MLLACTFVLVLDFYILSRSSVDARLVAVYINGNEELPCSDGICKGSRHEAIFLYQP